VADEDIDLVDEARALIPGGPLLGAEDTRQAGPGVARLEHNPAINGEPDQERQPALGVGIAGDLEGDAHGLPLDGRRSHSISGSPTETGSGAALDRYAAFRLLLDLLVSPKHRDREVVQQSKSPFGNHLASNHPEHRDSEYWRRQISVTAGWTSAQRRRPGQAPSAEFNRVLLLDGCWTRPLDSDLSVVSPTEFVFKTMAPELGLEPRTLRLTGRQSKSSGECRCGPLEYGSAI
jgi:hypothetical protein